MTGLLDAPTEPRRHELLTVTDAQHRQVGKNREIQIVINTPSGATPHADGVKIRTTAVYTGTPIMTTLSGAKSAALGIAALRKNGYEVKTLQEYH